MTGVGRALGRALALVALITLLGALWGAVDGVWIVAPTLVRIHHLIPSAPAHWLVLESVIVAGSAALGAVFALFGGFGLLAWQALRGRPYRDPRWALGLGLAALLPLAYLVTALLIEWRYFARLPLLRDGGVAVAAAVCAAFSLAALTGYARVAALAVRPSASRLVWFLGALVLLGGAALPFRIPQTPTGAVADGGPLLPLPDGGSARAPLLLVGIDSGNWQTLRPLMDHGVLPTFSRLVAEGVHGEIEALWPPYWSGPAWAAILTGHPREEVGVYADLTVHAPGLPLFYAPLDGNVVLDPYFAIEWKLLGLGLIEATQPPRAVLRRPPVWELLSHAGVASGVVRFDFTYPADGQAEYVVSNRVGQDSWGVARVNVGAGEGLVAPAALAHELLAPFSGDVPADERLLAELPPGPRRPRTPHVALELDMLRVAADIDRRTVAAGLRLLELRADLRFLAIYLGGFDNVCHAFWPYRFPDAYGDARPDARDVAEFGSVIDGYLRFLDASIARLLAAYPTPPNVIVVSDHGHEAILDHPLWRGWHGRRGMFIAHGPAFAPRSDALAVSYYDVVPTIADVMGLAVPGGMHGSSVRSARGRAP